MKWHNKFFSFVVIGHYKDHTNKHIPCHLFISFDKTHQSVSVNLILNKCINKTTILRVWSNIDLIQDIEKYQHVTRSYRIKLSIIFLTVVYNCDI